MLTKFNSKDSKGRKFSDRDEYNVNKLDPYLADTLIINQSKSERRLVDKTQVFPSPNNPHIRTRYSHSSEVYAISTTISELLNLNTYLSQSISRGHDLGHTPFGHTGESVLTRLSGKNFCHNVFGIVLVDQIETKGKGLNLTYETRKGIILHSRKGKPLVSFDNEPHEYAVVAAADKIAYTFSDLSDAIKYGFLDKSIVPQDILEFGNPPRAGFDRCIDGLVIESKKKNKISFTEGPEFEMFDNTRKFMRENVYDKIDCRMHKIILEKVYQFFEKEYSDLDPVIPVALLTDKEAIKMGQLLLESKKIKYEDISNFGAFEIIPYIRGKNIDYSRVEL